jgi:hypothetical protein
MVWVLSLSAMDLITHSLTAGKHRYRNSEFVWGWYRCDDPSPISALPPEDSYPTLPLKAFRGVRAISQFD